MTPKQAPHADLLEPIQNFLESLSQELTEQKFIPAFRDELRNLLTALENLQHSEDSLQQIAKGVDRLREVFAPAGTRLLEGVKDLETLMKSQASDLKERSGDVLRTLAQTHEQIEATLRGEANLLQEQSSASRDAISRVSAEMESRVNGLTSQLDSLFRKFENELAGARALVPTVVETPAAPVFSQATQPAEITVAMNEDFRTALRQTESVMLEELRRYRGDLDQSAGNKQANCTEDWGRIEKVIQESLSAVAPKIQDEFDEHVTRLRDQLQLLLAAQVDARMASSPPGEGAVPSTVSPELVTAAITGAENRILHEFSSQRKQLVGEVSGARKVLNELEKGITEAAQKQSERINANYEQVRETLKNLERVLAESRDADRSNRELLTGVHRTVDALQESLREQATAVGNKSDGLVRQVEQSQRALDQKIDEDRQRFAGFAEALQRVEQAATSAADLAMTEGRAQRERVDGGFRDMRTQIERLLTDDIEQTTHTLQEISQSWTLSLETLREHVESALKDGMQEVSRRLVSVEGTLEERDKSREAFARETMGELRRGLTQFDERMESLKSSTASFSSAVENHVKAVSGEVAALRARQDQQLSILREAIRANYDENAARLREVIDQGTDHFVKQAGSIPQSLDRYGHLIQSLHQADQIALQAISSDVKNSLALADEKFGLVLSDTGGTKKILPLLDRKLDKQGADLDTLRRAQIDQDKAIALLAETTASVQEQGEKKSTELKNSMKEFEQRSTAQILATKDVAERVAAELHGLQDEGLPGFKREITNLVASKFDFIEKTTLEREQTLRNDFFAHMELQRKRGNKVLLLIGLLITLGVTLQLSLQWINQIPK